MEITILQLKKNVIRSLWANRQLVFKMMSIYLLIGWLPMSGLLGIAVIYLLIFPFFNGMLWFFVELYQGEEKEERLFWNPVTETFETPDYQERHRLGLNSMLRPFNHGFKFYLKVIGLQFIVALFTALWTLLLIVPGIIKSISYSQAMYLLMANPQLGIMEAIKESRRLMEGQKKKYGLTFLSLFGWFFIPIFIFIGFFMLTSEGPTTTLTFDVILSPLYFMEHSNLLGAVVAFLIQTYFTFFALPYFWTVLGGFHRELVGKPTEETPVIGKSTVFSKFAMTLTASLILFSGVTYVHPTFVGLLHELGITSQPYLFYVTNIILEVDEETLVKGDGVWEVRNASITDETTVIVYEGVTNLLNLFEGLPLWDVEGTGEPAISNLTPHEASIRVQEWLEPRLEAGTATLGTLSNLQRNVRATSVGMTLDGESIADFIILSPHIQGNLIENVNFLGAIAAEGQTFASDTFLYFPSAYIHFEELSDHLLLEWAAENQGAIDDYSWIQLDLTNGHRIEITNTDRHLTTIFYMKPDGSTATGWSNLYFGEIYFDPVLNRNQVGWLKFVEDGLDLTSSPFEDRDNSPQSTFELIQVPTFDTIAEYKSWARNLDWNLGISLSDPNGRWVDPTTLGAYTIQYVFASYVGSSDHALWIEIKPK